MLTFLTLFIVHDALVYVKHPASSLGLIFSRVNDFLFFHAPVDLQTSKQLGIKVLQKLRIVRCQHIAGKCCYYLTNLNYGSTDSDSCR
jgi:hypothetical protein